MEFDWDEVNVGHIALHMVEPEEVEEALTDPDLIATGAYNNREKRSAVIGATEAGRILFVVYTIRKGRIRVVTAREASGAQKRAYRS